MRSSIRLLWLMAVALAALPLAAQDESSQIDDQEPDEGAYVETVEVNVVSVDVYVTDKAGQPVLLDSTIVQVGRPAFEQADHRVVMVHQGNGVYHATDPLQPGIWQVSVRGTSSRGDYRLDTRLVIKADTGQ